MALYTVTWFFLARSKIDKLSILGVRSFDNIRSETIQFHTPLTLIVGYNGSGKTTIIECLKYATTGQLPPNSKGGAFIHDPKLCGEKEVLAQVKLSFKGTSGVKLVVTRSLQLTIKKTTRQQKTLEAHLLMINDGERTTISSRVAELDQIMPQYLGVSEAILDSVIFCHQDESLWPMSEPGVLKKKFDEIFEAMKYTKAIENIKGLRKAQAGELGKHKMFEDQFKIDKDRGERAERQSVAVQAEIEKLREQSEQLNKDMQIALDAAREKHKQSLSFLGIINELDAKRNRSAWCQADVVDLRKGLEELSESDDTLRSTLDQYEEQMSTCRKQEADYRLQYDDVRKELAQTRKQLASKLAEQGQLQAEKEHHERQVEIRVAVVKQGARQHAMRGYDGDLNEDQIRDFLERLNKLSKEKTRELERVKKTAEDESGEAQNLLRELESRRSARTQDKITAKQTMMANERKINAIQVEVDDISVDEGFKAVLESSHRDLKSRLENAKGDFENTEWDKKLFNENLQLRNLEDDNQRLNQELLESTRLAHSHVELELRRKELKEKRSSLDTMVAAHGEKMSSVIGDSWNPSSLEREYHAVLESKSRIVTDTRRQRDFTAREMEQTEFTLSTIRDARKKKIEEMRSCQKAVANSILIDGQPLTSMEDYLPEMGTLENDRDILKSDLENFTHLNDFYSKCLVVAEQHEKCRLCDRKFTDPQEKSSAIAKLRQRLAADSRATILNELQKFESDLKEAHAARSHYEAYKRLADVDIPGLEKESGKGEELRTTLFGRLEAQDAIVRQEETAKREVESLAKTVSIISRYAGEISELEAGVSTLSTQQKLSGNILSLEELQEKLATYGEQTRVLKLKISKLMTGKERTKGAITTLELELRDTESKLLDANHQMEKKRASLLRIQELKESSTTQCESVRSIDIDLASLTPEIAKAKARSIDAQQRGREREDEIRGESSHLSETLSLFKNADEEVNTYIKEDGPTKLTLCQQAIKNTELQIDHLESDLSQITARANKVKEQVDNSERTKRTVSDNLKLREKLHELNQLNIQIGELESRNASEDYQRLQSEAQKLDMRHQRLLAERGPILGTMRAKDDELQRLLAEWETDYKDAARKYREAHIKVETTKAAIDDLGRYGNALDQAIMKYHGMKMEEINRIAGELWQSTYQGTDVDTILIRSDSENASNRRNFNYRVCMVKQDAEMDMRGRCSAGQRVLASIIIRLALAECFGVNCGLIALDEPTTNLDRDNIRSLAESLHGIIRSRQAQANFQLIVITHDEEFLRFMKCADFCDNYYRVSRDDKQKSIIERQSIAEVI